MNRRRSMYRKFNKKNRFNEKLIIISISIAVVGVAGGYGYSKIKNMDILKKISENNFISSIVSKIPSIDKPQSDIITSNDIEKELDDIKNNNEDNEQESSNTDGSEEILWAKTKGWEFYTIQVASVQDDKDLAKFEDGLKENKIPYSIIETDGVNKVQTHSFFDKEITRGYLDAIKVMYPDAFLSQMKIPMLSLEYTNKYEYVGQISEELNKLITNLEEESKFWEKNKDNINKEEYNKILSNRSKIVQSIEKEVNKIDYDGMVGFKENLDKYINEVNDMITQSSKAANEEQYHISKSKFTSCMQGYYMFIDAIDGE